MLSTVVKIMYRLYLRIVGFQKKKIRSINTKKKKRKKKGAKTCNASDFMQISQNWGRMQLYTVQSWPKLFGMSYSLKKKKLYNPF
jgi:hypothetical protein